MRRKTTCSPVDLLIQAQETRLGVVLTRRNDLKFIPLPPLLAAQAPATMRHLSRLDMVGDGYCGYHAFNTASYCRLGHFRSSRKQLPQVVWEHMDQTFAEAYERLPSHQLELQELALLGYSIQMNVAIVTFTGNRYTMWPICYQKSWRSWFLFFLRRPGIHWELLVEKRKTEDKQPPYVLRAVFSHSEVRPWLRHFGHELKVAIDPPEEMKPLLYDSVANELIPVSSYRWKEDEEEEEEEEEKEDDDDDEELSAVSQAWRALRVS